MGRNIFQSDAQQAIISAVHAVGAQEPQAGRRFRDVQGAQGGKGRRDTERETALARSKWRGLTALAKRRPLRIGERWLGKAL